MVQQMSFGLTEINFTVYFWVLLVSNCHCFRWYLTWQAKFKTACPKLQRCASDIMKNSGHKLWGNKYINLTSENNFCLLQRTTCLLCLDGRHAYKSTKNFLTVRILLTSASICSWTFPLIGLSALGLSNLSPTLVWKSNIKSASACTIYNEKVCLLLENWWEYIQNTIYWNAYTCRTFIPELTAKNSSISTIMMEKAWYW